MAKSVRMVYAVFKIVHSQGMGKDGKVVSMLGESTPLTDAECIKFCEKRNMGFKAPKKIYHITVTDKDLFVEGYVTKSHKLIEKLKNWTIK